MYTRWVGVLCFRCPGLEVGSLMTHCCPYTLSRSQPMMWLSPIAHKYCQTSFWCPPNKIHTLYSSIILQVYGHVHHVPDHMWSSSGRSGPWTRIVHPSEWQTWDGAPKPASRSASTMRGSSPKLSNDVEADKKSFGAWTSSSPALLDVPAVSKVICSGVPAATAVTLTLCRRTWGGVRTDTLLPKYDLFNSWQWFINCGLCREVMFRSGLSDSCADMVQRPLVAKLADSIIWGWLELLIRVVWCLAWMVLTMRLRRGVCLDRGRRFSSEVIPGISFE